MNMKHPPRLKLRAACHVFTSLYDVFFRLHSLKPILQPGKLSFLFSALHMAHIGWPQPLLTALGERLLEVLHAQIQKNPSDRSLEVTERSGLTLWREDIFLLGDLTD